jgi:adenylate cyclase
LDATELRSFVPAWLVSRLDDARDGESIRVDGALVFADVSGFTALSTTLASKYGAAGAERLSVALDGFFATLLDEVRSSGGVPISFAGDGLLACFAADDGDLAAATLAAARCALAMVDRVALLGSVDGVEMGLHAGVVAGTLELTALGGHRGHRAAVILGTPVRRLGAVFANTRRGEAVIATEALASIARYVDATPVDSDRSLLRRVRAPMARVVTAASTVATIDPWIPDAVRRRADMPLGRWGAEIRTLTLVFVQLGSIAEDGTARASAAVRALQEELELHHGSLHQVTVDEKGLAVTAAFGLGSPGGDRPATSAVRCALAMRDRLLSLEVEAGIGVATGRDFVGAVGDLERRELAIVGTTMIRAARMAQAAHGVSLDEASRAAIGEAVELVPAPSVRVRGESVPVYRAAFVRRRGRSIGGDRVVGRDPVRALLSRALDDLARRGVGAVVTLDGPAGIGKSRLADHVAQAARDEGISVLELAGDLPSVDRPYHGLRSELERRLGIDERTPSGVRAELVIAALRESDLVIDDAPLLAPALGLTIAETARTTGLGAQRRADLAADLVTRLLAPGPARVVLVDDAQWIDGATALVLERIVAASGPTLVLLCTRVPADDLLAPIARLVERAERIHLGALDANEVEALVAVQLGVRRASMTLAHWIGSRAGGNPFFVCEVAASLLAAGLVRVEDGVLVHEASHAELERSAPPPSVEAVVTRRIDALDASAQIAMKAASVLGLRFAADLLADLHPRGREAAHRALDALEEAGLVHRTDANTFEVAHRIVLDVAYGLLPGELRTQLHESAASRLEARGDVDAAELAWHWEHAGDRLRALRWLEAAWTGADRAGALVESHGLARRAHALTPPSDALGRARWLRRMSEASAWLSAYQRAIDEARGALAALDRPMPEEKRRWRTMLARGIASQLAHRIVPGRVWAHGTEADTEAALALTRAGEGLYFVQGDQIVTLACFLASVNAAERVGAATEGRVPNSFGVLGTALGAMGWPGAARYYHGRALRAATRTGEHLQIANALFHIAGVHAMRGEWAASDRTYEECAGHSRDAGLRHSLLFISGAQGFNALIRGDVPFAAATADEIDALASSLRHERGLALATAVRAALALLRGDTDAAIPLARKARDSLRAMSDLTWTHPASSLARAELLVGHRDAAIADARAVLAALRGTRPADYRRLEGFAASAETLARIPGHDAAEVDEALALLHTFARAQGVGWARYHLLHGVVLARRGERRDAERALSRSMREARARELAIDLRRAQLALATMRSDRESEADARAWLRGQGIAEASVEMSP